VRVKKGDFFFFVQDTQEVDKLGIFCMRSFFSNTSSGSSWGIPNGDLAALLLLLGSNFCGEVIFILIDLYLYLSNLLLN